MRKLIQLQTVDLWCPTCADRARDAVEAVAGVGASSVDYQTGRLKVELDPDRTSEDTILGALARVGYPTADEGAAASTGQLAHATDMTPLTCCTRCDRMQYELPHTAARHAHTEPGDYPDGGHGGMDHDMSDPTMAAAMERDSATGSSWRWC